jgi:hypothetical protein
MGNNNNSQKAKISIGGILGALIVVWLVFRVLRALVGIVKFGIVAAVLIGIVVLVMGAFKRISKRD